MPSLSNGLIAYYPFNGNAKDSSGYGNHAIFNNATLTTDRNNNANGAYLFNGVSTYIRVANSPSLNPDRITLTAIVKPMGFYNGKCHGNAILHKGDNEANGSVIYRMMYDEVLYSHNTNCFSAIDTVHQNFYADYGSNSPFTTSYTPYVEKNKWYCVTFTYDGTTASFYLDGTLIVSKASSYHYTGNADDLFFGKLNDPQYPYWLNGALDEVRIYNRALNADEVKSLCSTCALK